MPLLGNVVSAIMQKAWDCAEGGARCVPDQNHLLLELPTSVVLGADLVVHVEQLLQGLALGGHDESNDVHEKLRHWVAIEHDGQDTLHCLLLAFV